MSSDLERLAQFAARDPVYRKIVSLHARKKPHTVYKLIDRSAPEYRVWASIIQSCTRDPNKNYNSRTARYAARGITVCPRWKKDYRNFFEDMGPRPSDKHLLIRRGGALLYCKKNCCWGTQAEFPWSTRKRKK